MIYFLLIGRNQLSEVQAQGQKVRQQLTNIQNKIKQQPKTNDVGIVTTNIDKTNINKNEEVSYYPQLISSQSQSELSTALQNSNPSTVVLAPNPVIPDSDNQSNVLSPATNTIVSNSAPPQDVQFSPNYLTSNSTNASVNTPINQNAQPNNVAVQNNSFAPNYLTTNGNLPQNTVTVNHSPNLSTRISVLPQQTEFNELNYLIAMICLFVIFALWFLVIKIKKNKPLKRKYLFAPGIFFALGSFIVLCIYCYVKRDIWKNNFNSFLERMYLIIIFGLMLFVAMHFVNYHDSLFTNAKKVTWFVLVAMLINMVCLFAMDEEYT